jgi:hypothetical protein
VIRGEQIGSSNSTSPTSVASIYAGMNVYVQNSTVGSLAARWCVYIVNTSGSVGCRMYAGLGIYSGGSVDGGVDTLNIAGAISSNSTGNPASATGASWTILGGTTPFSICVNWSTSTYLNCQFQALSWDFKPSAGTGGWTISANSMVPDSDNATSLGSATNRIATVTTQNLAVGVTGALKGNGTGSPATQAACADLSNAGTGCSSAVGSHAELIDTFAPGFVSSIVNTKVGFTKWVATSIVDNLVASAQSLTCIGNPIVTFYECGTDATCASPTGIAAALLTGTGQGFAASAISNQTISATHYTAWAVSSGTCTALDLQAKAQVHAQ